MGEIILTWTQKGWASISPEAQKLPQHQGISSFSSLSYIFIMCRSVVKIDGQIIMLL